jgi:hypothetical protein
VSASRPLYAYLRGAVPMWVGTIFVVAGSIAAYGSLGDWRDAQRFEREAETAPAEVVRTSLERASREGNTRTRYLVTYRFASGGREPLEHTEEIPVEQWETLGPGSMLPIRYLSGDPSSARLRPRAAYEPLILLGVTLAVTILGLAIAVPWWRRAFVLARVLRSGMTTHATVLEVVDSGLRVNRAPRWQIKYEYRDERGALRQGRSDHLAPDEALTWHPGERATVRYDRDRPADSVWLGRS